MELFARKPILAQLSFFLLIMLLGGVFQAVLMGLFNMYFVMGGGMAKVGQKRIKASDVDVRWRDVIGMEKAKEDASELLKLLQNRDLLKSIGGKIIKGTLFVGPPGCGKTHLAKAIATEAGFPFLSAVGSDFTGILVAHGAERIKSLFQEARALAEMEGGCIIFIDEIDTIARHRISDIGAGGGGAIAHNATINQLLTEMDGLRKNENNIIIFAATNVAVEQLDPALMRSGRFDRKIQVVKPNFKNRDAILRFYLSRVKTEPNLNIDKLAEKTLTFSNADLENVVREAGINASRRNTETITMDDLWNAFERTHLSISKSGHSQIIKSKDHVKWDELIGLDEAKQDAWEIVSLLKDRHLLEEVGSKNIRCTLLQGAPGVGKTFLAKAIATEAGVPFLSTMGSEFNDVYMQQGTKKMKALFGEARTLASAEDACLIFIDEIDAFAQTRISQWGRVVNPVLDQFIKELDELRQNDINIIIIAATNMSIEDLDPGLLRAGRFDRKIELTKPKSPQRKLIIEHFLSKMHTKEDVDTTELAAKTLCFVPSDLENMIRDAGVMARRDNRNKVGMQDLLLSLKRIITSIEKMDNNKILSSKVNVPWDSVVGMDETKKEAWEIIELLKDRNKLKVVGGKLIKGILMFGPPGCGKTYLAKAIATETGFPFISAVGSEFVDKYVGEGARKLRELFQEARAMAKAEGGCIVFIDEIDSIAGPRQSGNEMNSNLTKNATVNQLLTDMDGLDQAEDGNIIIMAATNIEPDNLDPALMRSGRFDRKIEFQKPSIKDREELLKFYLSKINHENNIDIELLADKSKGFAAADVDNLVREAGIFALRENREILSMKDLTQGLRRVLMSIEKMASNTVLSSKVNIPWDSVIGMDETKNETWEIIELLKDRSKLKVVGGKIIKGILMFGPPGCGKTYLAKAIATEVGYPFISAVGSEFVDKYIGEGARKLRELFQEARAMAKTEGGCIVFIDEIDSIARPRQTDKGFGGSFGMNATVNQLLTDMDGLDQGDGNIIVLAATNAEPDDLDSALMRSGRFDRKIEFFKPSVKDRAALLTFYLSRVSCEENIDVKKLADKAKWFAAADIDNLVREAGIFALREKRKVISMEDLNKGLHRVLSAIEKMGGNKILGDKINVKWDSVVGMDETKKEAWEIVELLRDRSRLKVVGGNIVKGIIMTGPPGCGKTYLAKAIATESGFPMLNTTGADFINQKWAGTGIMKLKSTFNEARKIAKAEGGCIIFIDEIDAFVQPRNDDDASSNRHYNSTINQFLTELDGLNNADDGHVVVLAATNMPIENLDEAVVRSGRFDRKIHFSKPNSKEREALINFYLSKIDYEKDVDVPLLAEKSKWFSAADINNLIRESGILALREDRKIINMKDLLAALERVMASVESMGENKILGGKVKVKWSEVIGMKDAKMEAWEIVKLLKDRNLLKAVGGKIVKGLVMFGPPGCGKTYLAKAMASESGFPFISAVGSEFVGMYMGQGSKKIKAIFKEARDMAKAEGGCIIFIDEIDSFARPRSTPQGSAGTDHNATINQFLTELDGLKSTDNNIFVLGATNVKENELDPAVMRAGRLERKIHVTKPNVQERKEIFDFYLKKVSIEDNIDSEILARTTVAFTPSDIDNMIREAGLIALREDRNKIRHKDLSEAYDRLTIGALSNERYSKKETKITAYHEAGHAILTYIVHPTDEIIKATIRPRSNALGFVYYRTIEELQVGAPSKEHLISQIKVALAGYAAEKIISQSSGAGVSGDFKSVMQIAFRMVWCWGMGPSGLIGDYTAIDNAHISDKTKEVLDKDVQEIINTALKETTEELVKNRKLLDHFSLELIKKGDLEYDEVQAIFDHYGLKPAVKITQDENEQD